MIKVKFDIELSDFEAWGGGATTLKDSIENGTYPELSRYINDIYDIQEDAIDATQLNDLLWFDDYVKSIVYGEN